MKYTMVEGIGESAGAAAAALNYEVLKLLAYDWVPYGDPMIHSILWKECGGTRHIIFAQAMINTTDDKDPPPRG